MFVQSFFIDRIVAILTVCATRETGVFINAPLDSNPDIRNLTFSVIGKPTCRPVGLAGADRVALATNSAPLCSRALNGLVGALLASIIKSNFKSSISVSSDSVKELLLIYSLTNCTTIITG
ncbi:unnamed protein product [Meganyctiphanes norvegica]|uniref:Uncharacterized protein n=1 Tax=Meganyctiphanes norvegica TaxID=48144 RepID=A0AAV2S165_MEGNR